jgi:hypothetical protein
MGGLPPTEAREILEYLRTLVACKLQLEKNGKRGSKEYLDCTNAIVARLNEIDHTNPLAKKQVETWIEELQRDIQWKKKPNLGAFDNYLGTYGPIRSVISDILYSDISAGDKLLDYVRNGEGCHDIEKLPSAFRAYVDALGLPEREAFFCYIELEINKLKTVYTVKGYLQEIDRIYWILEPGGDRIPGDPKLKLPFIDPATRVVDIGGRKEEVRVGSTILVLRFGPLYYNYFNVIAPETRPTDVELSGRRVSYLTNLRDYLELKSPVPDNAEFAWPLHLGYFASYPETNLIRRKLAACCLAIEYLQNIQNLDGFPASAKLSVGKAWMLLYMMRPPGGPRITELEIDTAMRHLLNAVDDVDRIFQVRAHPGDLA